MPAVEEIVKHLVRATFENIPQETVEKQKDLLIDTLGVAVAGSGASGVGNVVNLLKEMGGKEESSVLVFGGKLPSFHTAMANSLMVHALDFDDMHEGAGIHANVCVVPAALAMAEKVGGIDGKTFLTAVILGIDLICRMGLSIPLSRGWHATTTFGIFGAVAASSKILALNEKQMANAFGLAYCQAAGNRQGRLEGTLTKRLQPAFAAKAGVLATLLARKDVTGPKEILEGDWGMLRLYTDPYHSENHGKILKAMVHGLGETFGGDGLSIKPYPSCKATHTSIEAALHLLHERRMEPGQIEAVEIFVSEGCYQTVGHPFEIRTDPQVDAQFSIPYTVATALLKGKVGLEDFTEAAIHDTRIMNMAEKVKVSVDPGLQESSTNVVNLESKVVIRANGKTYSHRCSIARGHPELPMKREEILSKFESCLQFATSLSPEKGKQVLSTILDLEKVNDVSFIATHLC